MEELLRQLNVVHADHERENELRAKAIYTKKTQLLLQSLKAGLINLDQVNVTADGWSLTQEQPVSGIEAFDIAVAAPEG